MSSPENRETPWACSVCGERSAHWSADPLPIEFREGTYLVRGFVHERCDACGETIVDAGQMDEIQRAAVETARQDLGRLNSHEIHAFRLELGLTQAALEHQLGTGTGTVGRWERGEVLQTRMADNFMRLLRAHPQLIDEPAGSSVARESRGPYRKSHKQSTE